MRDTGYGLTLGIHSRIQSFVDDVVAASARGQHLRQPQHDRRGRRACSPSAAKGFQAPARRPAARITCCRFATERTLTVNTAAVGGVTELLTRPLN